MADQIQQSLAVGSAMPGWRATRIARSESMWAVNEGIRQQYAAAGVTYMDVEPALTACDLCMDLARGNPYSIGDAEGILPAHPSCRCILVASNKDGVEKHDDVAKGWVTINGRHILLGDGGDGGTEGGSGKGGGGARNVQYAGTANETAGAKVASISGVPTKYIRTDKLADHEGAPDHTRVTAWKHAIQAGTPIPPLLVSRDASGKLGIDDGKHRFEAMRQLGQLVMPTINKDTMTSDQLGAYTAALDRAQTAMTQ